MFKEIFQGRPSEEGDLIPHKKPICLPSTVSGGGQVGPDDGVREAVLEEMLFGEGFSKTKSNSNSEK